MKAGRSIQTRLKISILPMAFCGMLISLAPWHQKENVIQVDIKSKLNGRAVTVENKNHLIPRTDGVDKENGYLTVAASILNKEIGIHSLPDNPLIKANDHHPPILLHYSNENVKDNQVLCIPDSGAFSIGVPKRHYKSLYLSMTSAYGSTPLQIAMIYENYQETKLITMPDWYNDIAEDDVELCYVVHDLGKWDKKNGLTEKDHHNIDAVILHPDANRLLKSVRVVKGKAGYLLLWAVTGVCE